PPRRPSRAPLRASQASAPRPEAARIMATCCNRVAWLLLAGGLLVGLPARGHAETLVCPEVGPGMVPDLLADPARARLVTNGHAVDVANEVYDLINRLQTAKPDISYTELTNVLIAAYCP